MRYLRYEFEVTGNGRGERNYGVRGKEKKPNFFNGVFTIAGS